MDIFLILITYWYVFIFKPNVKPECYISLTVVDYRFKHIYVDEKCPSSFRLLCQHPDSKSLCFSLLLLLLPLYIPTSLASFTEVFIKSSNKQQKSFPSTSLWCRLQYRETCLVPNSLKCLLLIVYFLLRQNMTCLKAGNCSVSTTQHGTKLSSYPIYCTLSSPRGTLCSSLHNTPFEDCC